MRPAPTCTLNPKIKAVWRLSALVVVLLCVLCCAPLAWALLDEMDRLDLLLPVLGAALLASAAVLAGVLPSIRFARWRYEVGAHELDIMRGMFWRKHFVIPFIRVQNTDTKQGPLMRAFGLAQVTVATAAGEHAIPGLTVEQAHALRDAIATQARLAREDV